MAALKIDLACGDYDLIRPLRDGAARAEGMEINFVVVNNRLQSTGAWQFTADELFAQETLETFRV
jgi:hypothetical protein